MTSNLLLGFYGDDFTGSTDAMDALSRAGVKTTLFLRPPDPDEIDELDGVQAIGLAGMSRSMSPEEMEETLVPAFQTLATIDLPLLHYKVCSTFDSAPETGSIGKAIDIGAEILESSTVPVLPGAPPLGRYVLFGHMFAEFDGDIYRLDRHPTMSNHPVTPMSESDLLEHLSEQTDKRIALLDILQLRDGPRDEFGTSTDPDILLFDSLQTEDLLTIGRLLWEEFTPDAIEPVNPGFVVGSSGLEYALAQYWEEQGLISGDARFEPLEPVEEAVIMSGSASPVTEQQIDRALENGFVGIRIRTEDIVHPKRMAAERERVLERATRAIENGNSVVMFTAKGPEDPAIERTETVAVKTADAPGNLTEHIGEFQGELLREVIRRSQPLRVCVAGGDTCGHVTRKLGIRALEVRYPLAPGSPVCRVTSSELDSETYEIALKGGQLGGPDYFVEIRDGAEST